MKSAVAIAIENHLAAVMVDEASFTDDGVAIDQVDADWSGALEQAAFLRLLNEPCVSHEDVQAKVRYVLDGTVGERQELMDCVLGEDGTWTLALGAPLMIFLRSLVTGKAEEER
jgi:hypothetical protein